MRNLKYLNSTNLNLPVNDKNLSLVSSNQIKKNHLFKNLTEPHFFSLDLYSDFTSLNLTKLNLNYSFQSLDPLLEVNPIDSFLFLRKSTVTSFFMMSLVDMPISLKKSKSLYVKTFEIQSLKLSNLLMRSGKRGLILNTLAKVLGTLSAK